MKIGLTYTGNDIKHQFYSDWLQAGDSLVDVVTLDADRHNAADLHKCDALVLSGGIDIHPDFYKGDVDYTGHPTKWNHDRDQFEKKLYLDAKEMEIPVLAICRGMQLVNVIEGGTLRSDLGDLNATHNKRDNIDNKHRIDIVYGSVLKRIVDSDTGLVNSAHHQSVDNLGNGLVANATAATDGTVEGIEWEDMRDKSFLIGVQWHPERMSQSGLGESKLSTAIRDRFFEETGKSQNKRAKLKQHV